MTKRISKVFVLLLVCVTLLSSGLPVFADVIFEPDDGFFNTHKNECEYIKDRTYLVNSDKGYAYFYKTPESDVTVNEHPNGEEVSIGYIYTDKNGDIWGVCYGDKGWVRMSEVSVVYDAISFMEDHGDELIDYEEGTYNIISSESYPSIVWYYPGKKATYHTLNTNIAEFVTKTYTDDIGNVWGYMPAYSPGIGKFESWVCLTDPYHEDVGDVFDHPVVELKEAIHPDDIPMSEGNQKMLITIGVLVGSVLIITAAVIAVCFMKKKKQQGDI